MEPNVFKPYKIVDHTKTFLHLEEPKLRKRFLFFFFRIYPWLMIAAIVLILTIFDFPVKYNWMIVGIGFVFLWLLILKNYIEEVKISNLDITVTNQTFFGKKTKTIFISDADKITVETLRISTSGGYFYRVKLKNSTKDYAIINIPHWYLNHENKLKRDKILEEITGLKVERW